MSARDDRRAWALGAIGATAVESRAYYVDGAGWVTRDYPSPIGPGLSWSYSGTWRVGDLVRLDAQAIDPDRGYAPHAGDRVRIMAIDHACGHDYRDLSIADRAHYDRFGASISYAIVFDRPADAATHRECGGSMESSSYAVHLRGSLVAPREPSYGIADRAAVLATLAREPSRGECRYCGAAITRAPGDDAWCDDSGACGCGVGEHEPGGFDQAEHDSRARETPWWEDPRADGLVIGDAPEHAPRDDSRAWCDL